MVLEAIAPSLDALEHTKAKNAHGAAAAPTLSDERAVAVIKTQRRRWLHASDKPRREAAAWLLAVVSLQSQRSRGFKLPLYLRVPMLPALGLEALLRRLANRLTDDGFPSLRKAEERARARAKMGSNAGAGFFPFGSGRTV